MISLLALAALAGIGDAPQEPPFGGCPAGGVLFAQDSDELDAAALNWWSMALSTSLGTMLRDGKGGSWVHVTGYIDDREAASAETGLDQRRAEAVTRFLIRRGVPPHLLRASAGGTTEVTPQQSMDKMRALQRSAWASVEMNAETWRREFPAGAAIC